MNRPIVFYVFQIILCLIALSAVLFAFVFVYSRLRVIKGSVLTDYCPVYARYDGYREFSNILIPLVLWTIRVQILPWMIDLVICILTLSELKKARTIQRRLHGGPGAHGNSAPVITSSDLKVSWIIICHCLCHLACAFPEVAYLLFLIYASAHQHYEFQLGMQMSAIIAPVFKILLSLPFTILHYRQSN